MRKAQHKGKRVLASALCVGMLASMVPTQAFAADEQPVAAVVQEAAPAAEEAPAEDAVSTETPAEESAAEETPAPAEEAPTEETPVEEAPAAAVEPITGPVIAAPMSGRIVAINVKPGQEVKAGDTVMVYEAMKMENDIESEISGIVKRVLVDVDDQVATDTALIEFEG